MPWTDNEPVKLFYEINGSGKPLVFVHEFAGDMSAWEPQVRHFSRRYSVITYNQRGYPPSDVPPEIDSYDHDLLVEDLMILLSDLKIDSAHLVGLATGANVVLNFAIKYPAFAETLTIAGGGAGTVDRDEWLKGAGEFATDIEMRGTEGIVANVENAPQRIIFKQKDPLGWAKFVDGMKALSPVGTKFMMRNALMNRAPIFQLENELEKLTMPILLLVGDQDYPAFEPTRFICLRAPYAGMAVLPMCGHTLNSEEPDLFNKLVQDFLGAAENKRWGKWKNQKDAGMTI